jgi:hypothetical protein
LGYCVSNTKNEKLLAILLNNGATIARKDFNIYNKAKERGFSNKALELIKSKTKGELKK